MSEREVVGRLGRALLTEESTEDDVARVLVALGEPVPEPAAPPATPGAPGTEPTTEDLAPTGVWVDPDELARSVSPAEASGASEEVADDPGLPRAATHRAARSCDRNLPGRRMGQGPEIRSLMREASASITKGFVRTAMPGSRWPFPTAAFSA